MAAAAALEAAATRARALVGAKASEAQQATLAVDEVRMRDCCSEDLWSSLVPGWQELRQYLSAKLKYVDSLQAALAPERGSLKVRACALPAQSAALT